MLQEINGSDVPEAASTNSCDEAIVPMTSLSLEAKEDATCPEIHTGPPIEDRKSVFQGHFAAISSPDQVPTVLAKLKSNPKIGRAFHNMWAYRYTYSTILFTGLCNRRGSKTLEMAHP